MLFSLDYHKKFQKLFSIRQKRDRTRLALPCFCHFLGPPCKVIRIGKRVQPDISKARQQVNIDRPAYNKTDKQCRTRTTITARLPDD